MTLLAFNNDAQLKEDLMIELEKHRDTDAIIKNTYGNESENVFRGCAVGCSINSYNIVKGLTLDTSKHKNYELFGIPTLLAKLEDDIFEGLPSTHNIDWPLNFMSAINVGADLSTVWPKFAQWLMTDEKYGVLQYARTDLQKEIIQKVSNLYKNGGSKEEFRLAANAAYAAASAASATNAAYAASATDAAYADYAAYVAYAAADAADAADVAYAADANAAYANAAYAAYANAPYYVASSAAKRFEVRIAQSEYLLKLLKECKWQDINTQM